MKTLATSVVLAVALTAGTAVAALDVVPFQLVTMGTGTASWTTDASYTGTQSVQLGTTADGDYASLAFLPFVGTIDGITSMSFWFNHNSWNNWSGPRFGIVLDLGGTGYLAVSGSAVSSVGTWTQAREDGTGLTTYDPDPANCWWYGFWDGSTYTEIGGPISFGDVQTVLSGATVQMVSVYMGVVFGSVVGPGDAYVDDPEVNGVTYYGKIQDAVDAAIAGDVINVTTGTYNEQVLIAKDVTVIGTGTVLIDPNGAEFEGPRVGTDAVRAAVIFMSGSSGATLDNVTIENSNASELNGNAGIEVMDGDIDNVTIQNVIVSGVSGHGFGSYHTDHTWPPPSGWLIENCQFSTSATDTWSGLRPQNMDNLRIRNCDIGPTNYGGILLINTSTRTLVEGNTVHHTVRAGIQVDSYCTETVNVICNEVYATNSAGAADYGDVRLYGQHLPDPHGGAPAVVMIRGNILRDGYNGVCVKNGQDITTRTITVRRNSITNHTNYGGYNGGTGTLDAENNWWGDATGPTHPDNPGGTGDPCTDNVDYVPWLTSPTGPSQVDGTTWGGVKKLFK